MFGRKRQRGAEAEFVGLHAAGLPRPTLAFVGGEDDWRRRLAQDLRETLVERGDAGAGVDQQQADIRLGDRLIGAAAHPRLKAVAGRFLETRRVDDLESEIAQMRFTLAPVARDARRVVHQCELLAHQPIEQRGLSDIGPSDNGDRE